ncbi:spore germination protein [Clostridium neuense]|uniref:Spore germination protein n=1 Tax=Clostridium neuense TaxID=1728934 RepID=A0ABW8TKW5_9CLOT
MKNTNSVNISEVLKDNMKIIDERFKDCPDIIRKQVFLNDNTEGYFIYIEGLIDTDLIQRDFIKPICNMDYETVINRKRINSLPADNIQHYEDMEAVISDVLAGSTAFLLNGMGGAVCANIRKFEKRGIREPDIEKNVRGPHEGFVEALNVNISILRRKIKNTNLKFKPISVGSTTNQTVNIAYMDGIADPQLIKKLYDKISSIDFDGILGAGYIEQMIVDFPNSIFPQYQATERSDRAVAALLEGRLLVITEGTPVVLIVPVTLFSFFKALDDYTTHWVFGSLLGILRVISAIIAIYLPSAYIALTTFHYYMVPLNLLIPLAESRARVPFPPVMEAFIMEIVIEMLREAAIRLPTYIGASIGVVGGIIIGQAAVQAGIVSELLIIVVAITAIASFMTPVYDMGLTLRTIRFLVMIATAIFGVIGIATITVLLLANLVILESLEQPYFQPIIPFRPKDLKDTIIRVPFKFLKRRPTLTHPRDKKRGKNND